MFYNKHEGFVSLGSRRDAFLSQNIRICMCSFPGGRALNFGLRVMYHQKRPYFFSLAFTERHSFLPTFTQWPPIFREFRHFWRNVENFLVILALKAPILDAFHRKTLYFCALCHSKTPFFDAICHRKTPRSEVLGGTRTWLSYVSAPPPGCSFTLNPVFNQNSKIFGYNLALPLIYCWLLTIDPIENTGKKSQNWEIINTS